MTPEKLQQYVEGGAQLTASIIGLSAAELDAFPVPGTWSIRQIVLHMLDSDLIASDRMKRIIAMDHPSILAYDETAFAKNLFYNELDANLACEVFAKNRRLTFEVLRRLPVAAFARTGNHSERGSITLEGLVETYIGHLEHHLKFVCEKRKLLGK